MFFKVIIAVLAGLCYVAYAQNGAAQLTYYHSYAPCCKGNPNYNPRYLSEIFPSFT